MEIASSLDWTQILTSGGATAVLGAFLVMERIQAHKMQTHIVDRLEKTMTEVKELLIQYCARKD